MLKFVLVREGGYSNNKDDLGGETNKGITHTTYDSYIRAKGLPKQSVKYRVFIFNCHTQLNSVLKQYQVFVRNIYPYLPLLYHFNTIYLSSNQSRAYNCFIPL